MNKSKKTKTSTPAPSAIVLATTKTADDVGTARLALAQTEAEALTVTALEQVELWQASDKKTDGHAAAVARCVHQFMHGDAYGEVLGIPLESTFNEDGSIKSTGLDRLWGIPDGTIRDLRDLGGVQARCHALGITPPTKMVTARKLLANLPKDDEGKSYRGERRFTNDEATQRMRDFAAESGDSPESVRLKAVKKASDKRLGRTDDAATSPTGDLTKALDAVTKALAKLPKDDSARAEARAAFTARGLPMTPKQMVAAIAWAVADAKK